MSVNIRFNPDIEGLKREGDNYSFDGCEVNDDTLERLEQLGIKPFHGKIKDGLITFTLTPEATAELMKWKSRGNL